MLSPMALNPSTLNMSVISVSLRPRSPSFFCRSFVSGTGLPLCGLRAAGFQGLRVVCVTSGCEGSRCRSLSLSVVVTVFSSSGLDGILLRLVAGLGIRYSARGTLQMMIHLIPNVHHRLWARPFQDQYLYSLDVVAASKPAP